MWTRALKLAALAAAFAIAVFFWLRTPQSAPINLVQQYAVAAVAAALIGGIGVAAIGSWVEVSVVSAVGIVAGIAYADSTMSDTRVWIVGTVISSILTWPELHLLLISGAFGGAFVSHAALRRWMRPQRKNSGGR